MTSFGRTSEMLDGCELFAFDDGAIRNSDEIQTEFRAEIRNRNSKFTMLTRIIMYRERKRCRTRDALTGPAKSDGESVEVGDPSPKTSERTLMNFSQTLMNFSRITQTESEKLRKFRTVSNGALSERSKWRRTGFAFDDVRARSSDTRNEHKQPTQVTSEERMNLSFIGFFGTCKVMVHWRYYPHCTLKPLCVQRVRLCVYLSDREAGAVAVFAWNDQHTHTADCALYSVQLEQHDENCSYASCVLHTSPPIRRTKRSSGNAVQAALQCQAPPSVRVSRWLLDLNSCGFPFWWRLRWSLQSSDSRDGQANRRLIAR